MTPAEQRERNFRLSKIIIDYFGPAFFRGKRILDLGAGNGELANIFAKLGSNLTCVDAREENLEVIKKKFPHIKTVKANLEEELPFEDFSFDLALSIDLLCHLKNYQGHLEFILRAAEHIVLETEILDSFNANLVIPINESKLMAELSFSGEGSLVTDKNIQNKLFSLNAKFKRIDETRLNTNQFRYDWKPNNIGRKAGNRRLWFIKADKPADKKTEIWSKKIEDNIAPNIVKPLLTINNLPASSLQNQETVSFPKSIKQSKDKRFVIVIPSYNNKRWCEKNITSALNQNYSDFRIIFIDDKSSDDTFEIVSNIVNKSKIKDKCTFIKNNVRIGALANLYNAIHSCEDNEIILTLDGDDWFPDEEVLNKLKNYYNSDDIWMTYGQYKNSNDGGRGVASQYPDRVIAANSFRSHSWGASHLRTFYAWLFKKINKKDLFYKEEFMQMTWDLAIMYPMLEMSGKHSKFISDILYVYNMENPISDHRVDVKFQQNLDRFVRNMPKYKPLKDNPIANKTSVGLMMVATGKYDRFIRALIASADKYFLNNFNVTYYVYTDSKMEMKSNRNIVIIPIEHRPFPYASMDRFKHFTNNVNLLEKEDYLYYVDVDCLFVDTIGDEIIGDLVGVSHCGYHNKSGPWENNPKSKLYISPNGPKKYKRYYGGGFSGGSSEKYLKLSKWCSDIIDEDAKSGVIPTVHDESVINRYFLDNEPTIILSPSFHYPQSGIERYKKIWRPDTFKAKILLLDKNHNEMRR